MLKAFFERVLGVRLPILKNTLFQNEFALLLLRHKRFAELGDIFLAVFYNAFMDEIDVMIIGCFSYFFCLISNTLISNYYEVLSSWSHETGQYIKLLIMWMLHLTQVLTVT